MARTTRVALWKSRLASKENLPPVKDTRYPRASQRELAGTRGKVAAILEHWEQPATPAPSTTATNTAGLKLQRASRIRDEEKREISNLSLVDPQQNCIPSNSTGNPDVSAGRVVEATRKALTRKHYEAKSKIEGVSGVGGGVSIWPAMDDMRLSREDAFRLAKVCLGLVIATMATFWWLHGAQLARTRKYTSEMSAFCAQHPILSPPATAIHLQVSQEALEEHLTQWHQDFLKLVASVQADLNMELSRATLCDILFLVFYTLGIVTLLYFLLDNLFSKNRLTPRRVKVWISLLCVVYTWTFLVAYLLACAQTLETATRSVVHSLNEELAYAVQTPLDLTRYHGILLYWRTRVLPPATRGLLSIMGIVQVQDVSYYLQYYSLPVLTALCTPVVKIIVSLRAAYKQNKQ